MQHRLREAAVDFEHALDVDPYALLPKWMHPRKSA
jgi:hypothetical protein